MYISGWLNLQKVQQNIHPSCLDIILFSTKGTYCRNVKVGPNDVKDFSLSTTCGPSSHT